MSEPAPALEAASRPLLEITGLNAYYGSARALEDVTFTMGREPVSIVGRNGMGKTTLCNTIMGISPPRAEGSIRFQGDELVGLASHKIARKGIGYVPQGRRLFPSLTVDQHLRIAARAASGGSEWTRERVYELFPRLGERRTNGGAEPPAASSRCSRSVVRSSPTRRSSLWTSRPKASPRPSSRA
jgi:branched-chain amino acid transport system ATP-binding protein